MKHTLTTHPLHLGLGATAKPQPRFTGMDWYESYGERTKGDGKEGRLVSMHTFDKPWGMWEMHPEGDEVVVCVSGSITLIQLVDGRKISIELSPGEYAVNPAGTWHTAEVNAPATGLFITAGIGTENRPEPPA